MTTRHRRTRTRGAWVFLFLVSPLIGLVGGVVTSMVVPWIVISAAILGSSGYEVWRSDHPGESARYELGWRVRRFATIIVTAVLGTVSVWLVASAIVAGVSFLVAYLLTGCVPSPAPSIQRDLMSSEVDEPAAR